MAVKWIAEIGSNHNQDLVRAKKLILEAKSIGCDAVKFQLFNATMLYSLEYIEKRKELIKCEFPLEWVQELYSFCQELKIEIGYSVFHSSFLKHIVDYTNFLKISSWDVLRTDLIQDCINIDKPFYISLGGISGGEFMGLFSLIEDKKDIILFHCCPRYPAHISDCNLSIISMLDYMMPFPIGWSDHTVSQPVIIQALIQGAKCIEFHFDLDDLQGNESKHKHVWTRKDSGIHLLIDMIKIGETATGAYDLNINKKLFKEERLWRADPDDGLRPMKSIRKYEHTP